MRRVAVGLTGTRRVPLLADVALPRLTPWPRRELAAIGALAGVVAAGVALVADSATTHRSFGVPHQGRGGAPAWVAGPLADYGGTMTAARFIVLVAAMWVCYLLVLAFADAVRPSWAIGAIVCLTLIFTIGPPLLSRDVFNYVDYARLGAIHHVNPYVHGPAAAHGDPIFPWVRWRHTPTVYGPLFTLGSYPLAPLGLGGALWSLKGMTGLASLACVGLIWSSGRRTGGSPVFASLLFGLNPVLLVFAVAGAHNDVIALVPLVAGISLVVANRPALGGASAVAAVAVKATAGIALPFMILGARKRRAMLLGMLAASAAIGLLAIAVFGSAATVPLKLVAQHSHYYFEQSVPAHVAVLLGVPPRSHALRMIAELLAAVAIAALLVSTAIRRDWLSGAGWATFALLVSSDYMLAWYTIWILPFAAVSRNRRLVVAALGLGTFVVVSRLYWLNQ